jgi:hypothetical protein
MDMSTVNFVIGDVTIESEWRDTPTARKLLEALPIESSGSYWGDEFYFDVPVVAGPEKDATDVVDPGTVAYWTAGHCLCLFWGPTPASRGGECRAASAVNSVGQVTNVEDLQKLRARSVRVEPA